MIVCDVVCSLNDVEVCVVERMMVIEKDTSLSRPRQKIIVMNFESYNNNSLLSVSFV